MNYIEIFVTFMLTWWVVFFLALPWGIRMDDEPIKGQASSAPKNPRIKLKMAITSVVTAFITLGLYFII